MDRRTVLSGTVTALSVGVAGCSNPTTERLPSAIPREETVQLPDSAPIVGETEATVGTDERGLAELRVRVREATERLVFASNCKLNPGESYDGNGWKSTGFVVEHQWRRNRYAGEGSASRRASLVQASNDDIETPYQMATTDDSAMHRWRIRFQSPMVGTTSDTFVTELPVPESLRSGDTVAKLKVRAQFSNEQQEDSVWGELPVEYAPSE